MHWYLVAVSLPVKIDAQKNPVPALLLFGVACLLLWLAVGAARRREERKESGRGRRSDTWSRRPPRY